MLSLNEATRVLVAAEERAINIGRPMNLAVTDEGGHLIAHVRMDGAWRGGVDLSIKKAYTACAFEIATKDLANLTRPGEDYAGISGNGHERVLIATGGIPLRRNGKIVGAIGVSGGSGTQDQIVAEAAARSFANEVGNGQSKDDYQSQSYGQSSFGQKSSLNRPIEERQ